MQHEYDIVRKGMRAILKSRKNIGIHINLMSAKPSLWARYRTLIVCFGTTRRSFKELVTSPWLLVSPLAVLSFKEGFLSYSVLMKELSLRQATKACNTLEDLIALEINPEFGVAARLTTP